MYIFIVTVAKNLSFYNSALFSILWWTAYTCTLLKMAFLFITHNRSVDTYRLYDTVKLVTGQACLWY